MQIDHFNFIPEPFYQDVTIKALGLTCKTLYLLAAKILKSRDELFEKMVCKFYTCTQMYNINSLKEAKLLVIGETHHEKSHQDSQKELILYLARREPVVLCLESLPSLMAFTKHEIAKVYRHSNLVSELLDSSENIHYIGWDDKETFQKANQIQQYKEEAEKLDKQLLQIKTEINNLTLNFNLTFEEINSIVSELGIFIKIDQFDNPYEYAEYLKNTIYKTDFDKKHVIQNKIEEALNAYSQITKKMGSCLALQNKIDCFAVLFKQARERILLATPETFPSRTRNMTTTLSKIRDCVLKELKIQDAIIIVIAGNSHIAVRKEHKNNLNFNLDEFYKELNNHRAVTLLSSKDLQQGYQ